MRSAVRVLTVFAMLWVVAAFLLDGTLTAWAAALFVFPALLFIWTFFGALPARSATGQSNAWRVVRRSSIVEAIGLVIVLNALAVLHLPTYVVPATIAIVGLHFLPMAVQLPERTYYATGAGCVVVAALSAAVPSDLHNALASLAASVILTMSAIMLTAKARASSPI